jgi:hypothetical protein
VTRRGIPKKAAITPKSAMPPVQNRLPGSLPTRVVPQKRAMLTNKSANPTARSVSRTARPSMLGDWAIVSICPEKRSQQVYGPRARLRPRTYQPRARRVARNPRGTPGSSRRGRDEAVRRGEFGKPLLHDSSPCPQRRRHERDGVTHATPALTPPLNWVLQGVP